MTESSHDNRKRRSWLAFCLRWKIVIPAVLNLLVLLSPVISHGWHLRGIPDIGDPFDVGTLETIDVPDEENAWVEYYEAFDLYVDPPVKEWYGVEPFWERVQQVEEYGWQTSNSAVRKWVADNNAAIEKYLEASKKPDALPDATIDLLHPGTVSDPTKFTDLSTFKTFSSLLLIKAAQERYEAGPWPAWKWLRAVLRSAAHRTRHSDLMQRMHAIGLINAKLDQINRWSTDPRLSEEQLQRARHDLEEAWNLRGSLRENFQWDYLSMKRGDLEFFDDPDEQTWLARLDRYSQGYPETFIRLTAITFANRLECVDKTFNELPREAGEFKLFVDSEERLLGCPELTVDEFDQLARRTRVKSGMIDMGFDVNEAVHGSIHQSGEALVASGYRQLTLALALHAYHRKRHRFPARLAQLLPEFIEEIPLDPYDGKPMKYRLDPSGAVVYSVYENLTDDGGTFYSMDQWWKSRTHGFLTDRGILVRTPGFGPIVAPKPDEQINPEDFE